MFDVHRCIRLNLGFFFLSVGGIKAVVWTDVVQGAVMMLAMLLVILYGLREFGGITLAWDRAVEGRRVLAPE